MPEPTDNKGGANDDAAAKAAADKVAADAAAAAKGAGNGAPDGEEMVTVKKSEFDQIKSDRDNYRTAVIGKKADERGLDGNGAGAGGGAGSGAGAGAGAGTASIDENKIKEIARTESNAAMKTVYDANESRAKRFFFKNHAEYLDDAQWASLMGEFRSKRGKATVEDIMDDFEDAVLLHKRATGKLDEYLKQQADRVRNEGIIEGMMGTGHNAGGAGDRNQGGGTATLSPKGEEMARAMHTDPEKVKKVDLTKDKQILNP